MDGRQSGFCVRQNDGPLGDALSAGRAAHPPMSSADARRTRCTSSWTRAAPSHVVIPDARGIVACRIRRGGAMIRNPFGLSRTKEKPDDRRTLSPEALLARATKARATLPSEDLAYAAPATYNS